MLTLDGKRVLLCEDHALNASITIKVLEHAGITVTRANNGIDGLNIFKQSLPDEFDAVLMDICMPKMNGLEAARSIRALKRPDAATIPIVAMTARYNDEDRQESLQAGMNAHLTKPVDPKELYSLLGSLIDPEKQSIA